MAIVQSSSRRTGATADAIANRVTSAREWRLYLNRGCYAKRTADVPDATVTRSHVVTVILID
jgi:hypothetical protein